MASPSRLIKGFAVAAIAGVALQYLGEPRVLFLPGLLAGFYLNAYPASIAVGPLALLTSTLLYFAYYFWMAPTAALEAISSASLFFALTLFFSLIQGFLGGLAGTSLRRLLNVWKRPTKAQ